MNEVKATLTILGTILLVDFLFVFAFHKMRHRDPWERDPSKAPPEMG